MILVPPNCFMKLLQKIKHEVQTKRLYSIWVIENENSPTEVKRPTSNSPSPPPQKRHILPPKVYKRHYFSPWQYLSIFWRIQFQLKFEIFLKNLIKTPEVHLCSTDLVFLQLLGNQSSANVTLEHYLTLHEEISLNEWMVSKNEYMCWDWLFWEKIKFLCAGYFCCCKTFKVILVCRMSTSC